MIHYKALGRVSQIEADNLTLLQSGADLPQVDEIVDPDFTGGRRTEDYLKEIRGGGGA